MKHPEGAIKSIYDFKKAAVPGAVFYIIFNDKNMDYRGNKFKWFINENFLLEEDHANHRWDFYVDAFVLDSDRVLRKECFWSPYGDLHFPRPKGICGYLFENYWHAYAYSLKSEEPA